MSQRWKKLRVIIIPSMFQLPKLPYAFDALEPYIDALTMELHYTKHHQAYVDKLNAALTGHSGLAGKSLEELLGNTSSLPDSIRQAVINHGGGHANHSFFWSILSGSGQKSPDGTLLEDIEKNFGSFEEFKKQFTEKAMTVFGSGWAFLILSPEGKLALKRHSFQNSPLMYGNTPILGLDVWEHAYYLKYQNRRAEYVESFWNIINWREVSNIYTTALSHSRA